MTGKKFYSIPKSLGEPPKFIYPLPPPNPEMIRTYMRIEELRKLIIRSMMFSTWTEEKRDDRPTD